MYVPPRTPRDVHATGTGNRNDDDVSSVGHSLAGQTITMDASVLRGVMAGSINSSKLLHHQMVLTLDLSLQLIQRCLK